MINIDISHLTKFIRVPTPDAWLQHAVNHIPELLVDHAHCERKAAATAINFISKYPEKAALVNKMSPLAREELLHFEKVIEFLNERNIPFGSLPPSQYGQTLHKEVTIRSGDERLCDQLIIGAIIEARSCERFYSLAQRLSDPILAKFYFSLVKAEARHFEEYLELAHCYGKNLDKRISKFLDIENKLVLSNESVFRFHSGIPVLELGSVARGLLKIHVEVST